MRRILNTLREIEWFATLAMIMLVVALVLAVLIAISAVTSNLWVLAVVLGFSAVVSAVFSHRV